MILKLQNAGKFITTSGSGYIPPSRNIIPSKKSPTAATINQWLKGTFSYITGIKDSDLIESKYRPSKETNTTTKYYTRKGLDYDVMKNLLGGKESSAKTFEGEPLYYKNFNDLYNRLSNKTYRKGRLLRTTDNSHLGEYTIGIGEDNNGRYVSYYDKFDWAPNEKLEIFSPYEIYNRIYEKDFNRMLKELNNETYSGSNPSGNWFFKSGMNNKGYFKFGGKTANARKWKHLFGGLLTNIDPRSDTTYKGYNPKPVPRNAGEMVGTNPLMDIFNFIETKSLVSSNPYLLTGTAPTPGKVNMSLYKDAKHLLKGPQYDEGFVNFVDRLAKGKINPRFITKNNTVSPANYNYVDLTSESIPRGFVKGNEVTPSPLRNLSEEGLVIKNAKPIKLYNPINTPEEAAAAKDWMLEHGYRYNPKGNPTKLKEAKEEVIKTTSKKPLVTVDKKIGNAKVNPHERYIDKKDYSKAIRQKDKYSRSMESEKASPTKSGNYRLPKLLIEEMKKEMDFHPYFRKIKEGYIKREANISYSKNPELAKKQLKKDWQKTLELFADFKKNGILGKKANGGTLRFLLEGGKNAAPSNKFLSKGWFKLAGLTINGIANNVGDFFGTDLGKGLLDVGKGLFNGYLNYKSNSSAIESQLASGKASLEETYQNAILEAVKNKAIKLQQFREKWKEALANGTTNDNFSDIVASHFGLEEYNSAVRNAENLKAYQLAMMELLAENAKGSMLGNLFGSVVLSGLGALGGIIGNKGTSTNTSTNTSTPTLNFFNSPSIQTKNAMAAPSYNFNTGPFNTKTIGGNLNF